MKEKMKKILTSLNPLGRCRKYNIPAWQCPQFLFLIIGLVIVVVILATYFIATLRIGNPITVTSIVLSVGAVLISINYLITRSFEKMAEVSRMKSEFIGIVSHQLRAPLTNLKYSLEVLMSGRRGKIEESEIEYFKILKENTQRMRDLINDLLTISKLEAEGLLLQKQEISLKELTKKTILEFRPFAAASNVEIRLMAEKNLPKVLADPLWLKQVIENLLDNAIRYIKQKGEVKIKIEKRKKEIYFEIQDTGVGIPKEEQRYIFQKFFRSKNILQYQTEGSGLGLHITKRILELMDGKIWFESEEGKGTTFYFTLPIK